MIQPYSTFGLRVGRTSRSSRSIPSSTPPLQRAGSRSRGDRIRPRHDLRSADPTKRAHTWRRPVTSRRRGPVSPWNEPRGWAQLAIGVIGGLDAHPQRAHHPLRRPPRHHPAGPAPHEPAEGVTRCMCLRSAPSKPDEVTGAFMGRRAGRARPEWLRDVVTELTNRHERTRASRGTSPTRPSVHRRPAACHRRHRHAGREVRSQAKLSQNRSELDHRASSMGYAANHTVAAIP